MAFTNTITVLSRKRYYTALDIPPPYRRRHFIPMGYLDHLAHLRKKRGLSQAKLAELVGVEQPTIQRWETGKREPDLAALDSLAKALGVPISQLLDGSALQAIGPSLFIKGEVAAGLWREQPQRDPEEWETFSGRPDIDAPIEDRGGMRVIGDSMGDLYPHGTIVEYVKLFSADALKSGKRVIVQREREDGELEVTVKEYREDDLGRKWLVPRSSNPEFQTAFRIDVPEPGIVETKILAVVVASVRPE